MRFHRILIEFICTIEIIKTIELIESLMVESEIFSVEFTINSFLFQLPSKIVPTLADSKIFRLNFLIG